MGIAIKLQTKDFSSENLGTVTFAEDYETTAMNKATAYCTAIGDTTYKTQLYQFFLELMYAGLWPKIYGLYPMLGDNLTKLALNAKDVSSRSLIPGANASAGDKYISYVNTVSTGTKSYTPISDLTAFSAYAYFTKTGSINGTKLLKFQNSDGDLTKGISLGTYYNSGLKVWFTIGTVDKFYTITNNAVRRFAISYKDSYVDVLGEQETHITNTNLHNPLPNLDLGGLSVGGTAGETIEASPNLFSGYVHFYCLGNMSVEELATFDNITADFMSSVKNITV